MKKQISAVLLALCLLVGIAPAVSAASVPAGSGTASDPFLIYTASEFEMIADFPAAYFQLQADISLPADWRPVGYDPYYSTTASGQTESTEADFKGVLDGNGYAIDLSGVGTALHQSLFFRNYGTVKNLRLTNSFSLTVDNQHQYATGMIARYNYGTIECCSAEGSLDVTFTGAYTVSNPELGGLVGKNCAAGVIQNCYGLVDLRIYGRKHTSLGSVEAGVIAGENDGKIVNCYAVGSGYAYQEGGSSRSCGGVAGYITSQGQTSGCYYDKDVLGATAYDDGLKQFSKSTTAMKMQAGYPDWDFTNVWYIGAAVNDGYPVLRCDRRFDLPAAEVPVTPTAPDTSSYDGIRVLVNGKEVVFDQPPVVVNNRTMVPLRAIFEALNATVEWHGEDQTILAYRGNTAVKLQLDVAIMAKQVSGGAIQLITLDAAPFAQNNRTLVPVRAIAEAFDCEVGWDGATQTVTVDG